MPNWCDNLLRVAGPDEDVKRFRDISKPQPGEAGYGKTDLLLNTLYPLPDGEVENWYDWCVEHWGTKWDIEAELDLEDAGYLEYTFDSAWAPPVAWLEKVSKQFPTLEFWLKYDEPGQGFMGIAKVKDGDVRDDTVSYF